MIIQEFTSSLLVGSGQIGEELTELSVLINEQIDDNFMTFEESTLSLEKLEALADRLEQLRDNHEDNKVALNPIIRISALLNDLVGTKVVLEDIRSHLMTDRYSGVNTNYCTWISRL